MTLPAAVEGTLMCVSSLTSSFAEKKFSSFSFPNIRPWAWNTETGIRLPEHLNKTASSYFILKIPVINDYIFDAYLYTYLLCSYLKLSLWSSSNDNHPLSNIWALRWGNLRNTNRWVLKTNRAKMCPKACDLTPSMHVTTESSEHSANSYE